VGRVQLALIESKRRGEKGRVPLLSAGGPLVGGIDRMRASDEKECGVFSESAGGEECIRTLRGGMGISPATGHWGPGCQGAAIFRLGNIAG